MEDGASAVQSLVPRWRLGWVLEALTADRHNQYLMIDSTIVRDGALCLKHSRRVDTRYDRHIVHFTGFVHLAAVMM